MRILREELLKTTINFEKTIVNYYLIRIKVFPIFCLFCQFIFPFVWKMTTHVNENPSDLSRLVMRSI